MNISQVMPEAPGALKTLMEQNALFALMAVIIVVLAWFSWRILNKYFTILESKAELKDVIIEQGKSLVNLTETVKDLQRKLK